jgi:hypothetical protein
MKMTFDDKKQADDYITCVARGYGGKKPGMGKEFKQRAYLCDDCGKWHLSSKPKLKGKQRKVYNSKLRARK